MTTAEGQDQAEGQRRAGDLVDAGIAAAEAAAKKLKGASSFNVTVSGDDDPAVTGGAQHLAVSVVALP